MKRQIKEIIFEEFSQVMRLIESDFGKNYKRKVNNFLLSQMDEQITASMVFVSSFESKSGIALENCAKRITKLTYGDENVPTIVNPRNITHNIDPQKINGQIVVTDVNTVKLLHSELRMQHSAKADQEFKAPLRTRRAKNFYCRLPKNTKQIKYIQNRLIWLFMMDISGTLWS